MHQQKRIHYRRMTMLVAVVAAGALGGTALAASAQAGQTRASAPAGSIEQARPAATPAGGGHLRLRGDADRLTGTYRIRASVVRIEARKTSATRATVRLVVNGTRIRAERDIAAGTATWGADGARLSRRDHRALLGLSAEMSERWVDPAGREGAGIGMGRDLTLRLTMLAAEAAPGFALTDQDTPRTQERRLDKSIAGVKVVGDDAATPSDSCLADVLATTRPGSAERKAALIPCDQGDEDGIAYWSCSTIGRTLTHDANAHCLTREVLTSGPRSSGCLGECGPSCAGLNIYTYDCGDHDRCGRVHGGSTNPWDAECGDEYWEADDDFLWGWPNCS